MNLSSHAKGVVITALGVIALSPDGLLTRLITADALTITFWRGLFYGLGMGLLLLIYHRTGIVRAFLKIGLPGLLLMVFYAVGNLTFIYSITHTTVANTLFIVATTPLFAALISWIVFRKKVAARTWVAIFITAVGIYIICDAPSLMPDAQTGNLSGLLAALALAASFTVVERNRDRDLFPALVLGGFAIALVLLPWVEVSQTNRPDLFYLFIMGFILLPVANTLMFIGPKFISAPEVSLMMLLESVLGPFWVWVALGEDPGSHTLIGGTIVLVTLAIHSLIAVRKIE